MPSWPDAPSAWQPGGSQHYDSGMLPARLLPSARRAGIAVCTNPRHARDLTPNETRADAAAGTTAAPAGDVRGTACPLPPGARALLRRCREEQPQYQENDVIDVRLHAADAIVFLDFSPFRCACRAIRRSPERADFWKWLLLYRRRSRPVLRQAVAEHAGDAELYVLPTPRAVRRFIAKIASGMPDSP